MTESNSDSRSMTLKKSLLRNHSPRLEKLKCHSMTCCNAFLSARTIPRQLLFWWLSVVTIYITFYSVELRNDKTASSLLFSLGRKFITTVLEDQGWGITRGGVLCHLWKLEEQIHWESLSDIQLLHSNRLLKQMEDIIWSLALWSCERVHIRPVKYQPELENSSVWQMKRLEPWEECKEGYRLFPPH